MADLIDRQNAIDAIDRVMVFNRPKNEGQAHIFIRRSIMDLPSAQPETEERTTETVQNVSDSDLISRKAAIDAMLNMDVEHRVSWLDAVIDTLDELPSAQPEIVRCVDCVHSDTFPKGADNDMPLKCLDIRYGGVMPDWYCEHAERRTDE